RRPNRKTSTPTGASPSISPGILSKDGSPMADDNLFDLPEDIDDQIRALVEEHPTLTQDRVLRDIARIHCLLHMVNVGILGDDAVLTDGMAMRCYNSQRFSVYDSDTSSIPVVTEDQLLRALNYEDD